MSRDAVLLRDVSATTALAPEEALSVTPRSAPQSFYAAKAQAYAQQTFCLDMKDKRAAFLAVLPRPARILDVGCGSGRDALAFAQDGHDVRAIDACPQLVELAKQQTGLPIEALDIHDLAAVEDFDGIWACASLVHMQPDELLNVLGILHRALKPAGVAYISLKKGAGLWRASDGREFYGWSAKQLLACIAASGETWPNSPYGSQRGSWSVLGLAEDCSRLSNDDVWLNVLLRKNI